MAVSTRKSEYPRDIATKNMEFARETSRGWAKLADRRGLALRNIIAMETPNCAHVGKKMASVARAGLGAEAALNEGEVG